MKTQIRQAIEELLCSAIEGGSNYWYLIESHNAKELGVEFVSELLLHEGAVMRVSCSQVPTGITIKHSDILPAWERFVKKHPKHHSDVMKGYSDATTGDVFFQELVLKDVIYG